MRFPASPSRPSFFCALTLSLVFAIPIASAQLPSDNPVVTPIEKAIDKSVTQFFAQDAHVGLSIGIYDHGKTHFYNYGTTNKSKPTLPTRNSIYEIASITKTFTGALASRAVLDGKMTLDSDFRSYLTESYPNLEENGKFISLRLLASHRAGLPKNIPDTDELFKKPNLDTLPFQLLDLEKPYDDAAYLHALHTVELRSEPGTDFVYSNFGIKIIGFGLQNIYHQPLAQLLKSQILDPLKMKHTSLDISTQDKPLLVQGYSHSGKPMPLHPLNAGAAGGLYSNAEDMLRYIEWQLNEKDPVIAQSHSFIYGASDKIHEAMIWYITDEDGEKKIWESGGAFGMASQLVLYPDSNFGIILLTNDGGFSSQDELAIVAKEIHAAYKSQSTNSSARP